MHGEKNAAVTRRLDGFVRPRTGARVSLIPMCELAKRRQRGNGCQPNERSGLMQFFAYPCSQESPLPNPLRRGDAFDCLDLFGLQANRHDGYWIAFKEAVGNFFQLIFEIREIMCIPKLRQLFKRIRVGNPWWVHRFFHWLNRRCSFCVIGRAVTGKPLPSGNWMMTQNRYRPASVCPKT